MTAMTFILGVFPMVIATGPGASSQISIGVTVFFGMIAATLVGIIFIPALFALFESIKEYFYPAPAKNNLDTSSSPTEPRSELSEENAKSDLQPLEKNTKTDLSPSEENANA